MKQGTIFSFTRKGCELGQKISNWLGRKGWQIRQTTVKEYAKLSEVDNFTPNLNKETQRAFQEKQLLLFIGASGIAVRSIAPYLKSKVSDPAVLVVDASANFVIPLISGHIGGANELARELARFLGAVPILTTATDAAGLFAVDEWARREGLRLSSLRGAKEFSAKLLDQGWIGLASDFPIATPLPPGVRQVPAEKATAAITVYERGNLLLLFPVIVHLGIGCRRQIDATLLQETCTAILEQNHIAWQAVADLSSIDVKRGEKGLLALAQNKHLPLAFYSAMELNGVAGNFSGSAFVQKTVGTDNVCERAAVRAAGGGVLILKKTARNGVTLAAAVEDYQVHF